MRQRTSLFSTLLLAARVSAELHHLFVPSFTSPHIYSLEYNDETNAITQAGHTIAHDGHPWISFSYDKSQLYAGERGGFASYAVENSTSLAYKKSVPLLGKCGERIAGFGTTYILPLLKAPFTVYGAPFGNCINTMAVEMDGTLQEVVQNVILKENSGIHGMAMDPTAEFLYSADDSANGIWVHRVNARSGALEEVGFTPAPKPNSGPRHLIAHPLGRYLYVVMEASNEVAVYAINYGNRMNTERLTFTGMTYSLIPKDEKPENYMADEVLLSVDNNILFASTRYKEAKPATSGPPSKNSLLDKVSLSSMPNFYRKKTKRASKPGYVTGILLVPLSELGNIQPGHEQGPGFPIRQLFQMKTSTSGGQSNAVSPAPFDRDYFAISDTELGQVEIYKISGATGDRLFYDGATGRDAATAAKGGWENGMWVEVLTPPKPTEAPGGSGNVPTQPLNPYAGNPGGNPWNPYQNGLPNNPYQAGNPWVPKQTGNPFSVKPTPKNTPYNPWGTPKPKSTGKPANPWQGNPWTSPWGPRPKGSGDDDDDDYDEKLVSIISLKPAQGEEEHQLRYLQVPPPPVISPSSVPASLPLATSSSTSKVASSSSSSASLGAPTPVTVPLPKAPAPSSPIVSTVSSSAISSSSVSLSSVSAPIVSPSPVAPKPFVPTSAPVAPVSSATLPKPAIPTSSASLPLAASASAPAGVAPASLALTSSSVSTATLPVPSSSPSPPIVTLSKPSTPPVVLPSPVVFPSSSSVALPLSPLKPPVALPSPVVPSSSSAIPHSVPFDPVSAPVIQTAKAPTPPTLPLSGSAVSSSSAPAIPAPSTPLVTLSVPVSSSTSSLLATSPAAPSPTWTVPKPFTAATDPPNWPEPASTSTSSTLPVPPKPVVPGSSSSSSSISSVSAPSKPSPPSPTPIKSTPSSSSSSVLSSSVPSPSAPVAPSSTTLASAPIAPASVPPPPPPRPQVAPASQASPAALGPISTPGQAPPGQDQPGQAAPGRAPPASGVPPVQQVTVKVVATWKAPRGSLAKLVPRSVARRQILPGIIAPNVTASTAPAAGCCGNALWWD